MTGVVFLRLSAHALGQLGGEFTDALDSGLVVRRVQHPLHEGRTDDHTVGEAATSAACRALETPSPTQTGRSLPVARVRSTRSCAWAPTDSRVPVTPISEAAYTKPLPAAVISASRASLLLGATTKTVASPCFCACSLHSADSCTGRSGRMHPAPPLPPARR